MPNYVEKKKKTLFGVASNTHACSVASSKKHHAPNIIQSNTIHSMCWDAQKDPTK